MITEKDLREDSLNWKLIYHEENLDRLFIFEKPDKINSLGRCKRSSDLAYVCIVVCLLKKGKACSPELTLLPFPLGALVYYVKWYKINGIICTMTRCAKQEINKRILNQNRLIWITSFHKIRACWKRLFWKLWFCTTCSCCFECDLAKIYDL
jgi:hypothetical protein